MVYDPRSEIPFLEKEIIFPSHSLVAKQLPFKQLTMVRFHVGAPESLKLSGKPRYVGLFQPEADYALAESN